MKRISRYKFILQMSKHKCNHHVYTQFNNDKNNFKTLMCIWCINGPKHIILSIKFLHKTLFLPCLHSIYVIVIMLLVIYFIKEIKMYVFITFPLIPTMVSSLNHQCFISYNDIRQWFWQGQYMLWPLRVQYGKVDSTA